MIVFNYTQYFVNWVVNFFSKRVILYIGNMQEQGDGGITVHVEFNNSRR